MRNRQHYHGAEFYRRNHLELARELLGCTLEWDGCAGVIVETEAYGATNDEACHTFFRKSARAFFEAHGPGTVYAYINYGIYWLLNVLAEDGIVLIRAMEPTDGLDLMRKRRGENKRDTDLCSGPGKLGVAIALGGDDHGTSLVGQEGRGLRKRPSENTPDIVSDVRVGISKATDLPWRFLVAGNPHVSVPAGRVKPPRRS